MATRTTTVALEVVADVAAAASGLGSVETAAQGAAREVGNLTAAASDAPAKLDAVSGAAGGLDSAGAGATGAMGALASGFELVGATGAAETLQNAALATDFLSGVGQTAALAVQGQAAATKALTVVQKAANAAMRANPIGLVVTAILLLVGAAVLAYNKVDGFRAIVQTAGRIGKAAFESVSDAAGAVVTWVRDRIPPVFKVFTRIIELYLTPTKLAFGLVRDAVEVVADWVGKLPAKFGTLKDKAAEIAAPMLSPFTAVKDALAWIADKLDNIKPPAWLSSLMGGSSGGYDGRFATTTTTAVATPTTVVNITVDGALDPYAVAVQIRDLLARYNLAVTGV